MLTTKHIGKPQFWKSKRALAFFNVAPFSLRAPVRDVGKLCLAKRRQPKSMPMAFSWMQRLTLPLLFQMAASLAPLLRLAASKVRL